jgi:hypothetical protein
MAFLVGMSWNLSLCQAKDKAKDKDEDRGTYVHALGTLALGTSLRFNNPYRLERPLGQNSESVSLAASYLEWGGMVTFGSALGWQHGASLRWTQALSGISQTVVTPSYALVWRRFDTWFPFAHIGLPYIVSPQQNVGFEFATGAVFLITGSLGLVAETGMSFFYGAATREVDATLIPLWYGQLGLAFDWEWFP